MTDLAWTLVAAAVGALLAPALAARSLADPPAWSLRTNVSGKQVPAVLGGFVVLGGAAWLVLIGVADEAGWVDRSPRVEVAVMTALALLGVAGSWDDRRGDEAPRGFAGHLTARRVTGGIVKIAAGGLAGVGAGYALYPDRLEMAAATALAVPLSANLFNLLDRAPGRTGKVALLAAVPLLAFGNEGWAIAAGGTFGALAALLPADLGERGMLGDAGSNPIGAVIGVGAAASLPFGPLAAVVVLLLALNLASERWSFSAVIERTPALRSLDRLGRK